MTERKSIIKSIDMDWDAIIELLPNARECGTVEDKEGFIAYMKENFNPQATGMTGNLTYTISNYLFEQRAGAKIFLVLAQNAILDGKVLKIGVVKGDNHVEAIKTTQDHLGVIPVIAIPLAIADKTHDSIVDIIQSLVREAQGEGHFSYDLIQNAPIFVDIGEQDSLPSHKRDRGRKSRTTTRSLYSLLGDYEMGDEDEDDF